jgi:hypothetical protein
MHDSPTDANMLHGIQKKRLELIDNSSDGFEG